jgi:hypothetical protein
MEATLRFLTAPVPAWLFGLFLLLLWVTPARRLDALVKGVDEFDARLSREARRRRRLARWCAWAARRPPAAP